MSISTNDYFSADRLNNIFINQNTLDNIIGTGRRWRKDEQTFDKRRYKQLKGLLNWM